MRLNPKKKQSRVSGKTLSLNKDEDLVKIREYGRFLATKIGFDENERTLIATAISEVCRNVIEHADCGKVRIEPDQNGIMIIVKDEGPGIENVDKALQEGYSTGKGLGIGLPGAKRIMDTFKIKTRLGEGTTLIMSKSLKNNNMIL